MIIYKFTIIFILMTKKPLEHKNNKITTIIYNYNDIIHNFLNINSLQAFHQTTFKHYLCFFFSIVFEKKGTKEFIIVLHIRKQHNSFIQEIYFQIHPIKHNKTKTRIKTEFINNFKIDLFQHVDFYFVGMYEIKSKCVVIEAINFKKYTRRCRGWILIMIKHMITSFLQN